MEKYAILASDGRIVNIIVWDGVSAYSVPDGFTIELANNSHLQKWNEQNTPIDGTEEEAASIILGSMLDA